MTGLDALALPILLSAVIVFAASSLIHMLLPWHKNDYRRLPREDEALAAFRSLGITPGDYMAPMTTSMEELRSPEFKEKMKQGPFVILTLVRGGSTGMAKSLVLWFLYILVISIFAGYVAGRALPPGSPYLAAFRFAGTTAFVAHAVGLWQMSIWYHRSWLTTFKATVDGLVYALLAGGVFGWLWPR
ncbi:MAG: hypothetical protein C4574_02785 [Candidatus Latescibacterota bacterium]|jgi:hypothetical protein|nr:MAG: hypothetical protein C4574_02785 [Candidatus Latescibacterota bacterium]